MICIFTLNQIDTHTHIYIYIFTYIYLHSILLQLLQFLSLQFLLQHEY